MTESAEVLDNEETTDMWKRSEMVPVIFSGNSSCKIMIRLKICLRKFIPSLHNIFYPLKDHLIFFDSFFHHNCTFFSYEPLLCIYNFNSTICSTLVCLR